MNGKYNFPGVFEVSIPEDISLFRLKELNFRVYFINLVLIQDPEFIINAFAHILIGVRLGERSNGGNRQTDRHENQRDQIQRPHRIHLCLLRLNLNLIYESID